jgi:uncharacterized membrane protein YqjE
MATLGEGDDQSDGIISLVKETASGIGQLVADHIRLARIEMTADAKTYARDVGVLLAAGFIVAVGYGLACIGAGAALARVMGTPLAFVSLGVLHILIGAIALAMIVGRMKHVQLMQGTKQEVSRSVSALTATVRSH